MSEKWDGLKLSRLIREKGYQGAALDINAGRAVLVDALKDIASTPGTSISKRAKAQAALEQVKAGK